ncbi:hypothetical protein DWQ65_09810 [Treponema phagedenis]|nr:hypothetical protein DWQ65_09810 [Treponema phagedenis]
MLNSKRCFKASTQNCKIEALKLVGEPKVEVPKVRPMVSLPTVGKIRTGMDARGSTQKRCFKAE